MPSPTCEDTSLRRLMEHFSRTGYEEALLDCADKRTGVEALRAIYEHYFSPQKDMQSSIEQGLGVDDLSQIMKYKLCRGKWRPRLQQLVESNPDELCRSATKEALAGLIDRKDPDLKLADRMKCLIRLKAVGPATASLILSIFDDRVPFFGDQLAAFFFPSGGKLKYDVKEYLALIEATQLWLASQIETSGDLQCNPRELEEMVWYWDKSGGPQAEQAIQSPTNSRGATKRIAVDEDGERPLKRTRGNSQRKRKG